MTDLIIRTVVAVAVCILFIWLAEKAAAARKRSRLEEVKEAVPEDTERGA